MDAKGFYSRLFQVMVWCYQLTSHNLSHPWQSSMQPPGGNELTGLFTKECLFPVTFMGDESSLVSMSCNTCLCTWDNCTGIVTCKISGTLEGVGGTQSFSWEPLAKLDMMLDTSTGVSDFSMSLWPNNGWPDKSLSWSSPNPMTIFLPLSPHLSTITPSPWPSATRAANVLVIDFTLRSILLRSLSLARSNFCFSVPCSFCLYCPECRFRLPNNESVSGAVDGGWWWVDGTSWSRDKQVVFLTHWSLGDLDANSKLQFLILFYWLVPSHRLIIMPWDECHRTSPMISQHWFN